MYSEAKLREARFFLDQIRGLHHADDEFAFYLSALVSSFRSVTFAMQFEYSGHPYASGIYEDLQQGLKGDVFALAMRDARNDQQKQGHTWPRVVLARKCSETGIAIQFEGAPLPGGFDRLRSISVVTPPQRCLPLTGDPDQDAMIALRQAFEAVLSMRGGEWHGVTLVKVHKDLAPMSLADFFEKTGAWLKRFEEAIEVMDRNVPATGTHHVMNETEATLIASFGQSQQAS